MADGEFVVVNRYGDAVQRGEIHVTDVEDHGDHRAARVECEDPAQLRMGDVFVGWFDRRALDL